VHDAVDAVLVDEAGDQGLVAHVAHGEGGLLGNGPAEACRQVIENHNLLARIHKFEHHVAADIARAARHQNRHLNPPARCLSGRLTKTLQLGFRSRASMGKPKADATPARRRRYSCVKTLTVSVFFPPSRS
jgi:hypothetical protein